MEIELDSEKEQKNKKTVSYTQHAYEDIEILNDVDELSLDIDREL